MNSSRPSLRQARELDRADSLSAKREQFLIPEGTIYLNGNSLGPLTRRAAQRAREIVEQQWGEDLIASWNKHDWIGLPLTAAEKLAALVGVDAGQLICCDSVSINLLKLLTGALQMQQPRRIILSQEDNFPTDLYVAQGLEDLLEPTRCRLKTVGAAQLVESLDESVAVLLLSDVNFRSGDRHDIQQLSALAREKGVLVIWDLSHSVGVLPLQLDAWGVDFAVGCTYKYLNGGPGAPAFIYANRRHQGVVEPFIRGWMGHSEPFTFSAEFRAGAGMAQFLTGTPAIVSMAVLDSALDVFADLDIADIHRKAIALSEFFIELMRGEAGLADLTLESQPDPERRGAQLAFSHPDAYGLSRALNEAGLVVDFRSPTTLRLGFSPLFLRFEDIWQAAERLRKILLDKSYRAERFSERLRVT